MGNVDRQVSLGTIQGSRGKGESLALVEDDQSIRGLWLLTRGVLIPLGKLERE